MKTKYICIIIILVYSLSAFSQNKDNQTGETDQYKCVIAQLDSIYSFDQKFREESQKIGEKFGNDSKEYQASWDSIHKYDSINVIKVSRIIETHGWLGISDIGEKANKTIWLVIQHAPLEKMLEYLPLLKESARNEETPADMMALTEDRILMYKGKPQIYGSQLSWNMKTNEYFVYPIENPDSVDIRRAKVGLDPMSEYVKIFDLKWDLEEHKKQKSDTN
jgi:hypothetical protein